MNTGMIDIDSPAPGTARNGHIVNAGFSSVNGLTSARPG